MNLELTLKEARQIEQEYGKRLKQKVDKTTQSIWLKVINAILDSDELAEEQTERAIANIDERKRLRIN